MPDQAIMTACSVFLATAVLMPLMDRYKAWRVTGIFLLLALAGCDRRPDQWNAYIYPDRSDLSKSETINGFKTFEQCQAAAIDRLRSLPNPDGGDYECGYKCAADPSLNGLNVCKETRK